MALFCLVHGSIQSPAGWARVVPELKRRGHRTLLVDLPVDEPQAGVSRYVDAIAGKLDEVLPDLRDVVLVGHSVSGIFLPPVAAVRRIRLVVYLAAFVPELGRSPMEQFQAEPLMFNPEWVGKDPRDDAIARHFLFHDCPPDVLAWALGTRRVFVAEGAIKETCPLSEWPPVEGAYIVCQGDRTIAPEWSRRVARKRLAAEPIELQGGHCPHVSRPEALAEALNRAARGGGLSGGS